MSVIDSMTSSAPFSRACWLVQHHQLYSGIGADIVMESFHSLTGLLDTSWGANLALLLRLPPLCPARFLSCDNPFTGGWGHGASFAGTD